MSAKKMIIAGIITVILLLAAIVDWVPAAANQSKLFPAEIGTIESGKQGLVLSNVPSKVKYVAFETFKPPLPARYTQGVDISYRGPIVEVRFLNHKKEVINYSGATAQVYFNISIPEKNMWDAGGANALAIWHYDEDEKLWNICPTVLVAEKSDNGKYNRLACFVQKNGIYILGKFEFDPAFPLLFKPYDKGDPNATGPEISQSEVFSAQTGTYGFGKQGVILNSIPYNVKYVSFLKIQPPLQSRYHLGVDIAYRGPVVNLTFLNAKKAPIVSSDVNAQVYFNISTPEKMIWDHGRTDEIAIWFFNEEDNQWETCPTIYVPEKSQNGKYDRLTCYTSQNGIYMLGKMEFDPVFPEWFKPYDKNNSGVLKSSPPWEIPG